MNAPISHFQCSTSTEAYILNSPISLKVFLKWLIANQEVYKPVLKMILTIKESSNGH